MSCHCQLVKEEDSKLIGLGFKPASEGTIFFCIPFISIRAWNEEMWKTLNWYS